MKKLIFVLFVMIYTTLPAQVGTIYTDTTTIVDSWIPPVTYAAGEIIRAKDSAFFSISTGTGDRPSWGYIRSVIVETDTNNVTANTFTVRFYNFKNLDTAGTGYASQTDTTGYNVLQGVDNAAAVNNYQKYDRFFVGDVATVLQAYAAGGTSTGSAKSVNMAANLPFVSYTGKLWVSLYAAAAYAPKKGGRYRIRVTFERPRP